MTSHSRSYGEELQRSIFVQIASAIGNLESAIGIRQVFSETVALQMYIDISDVHRRALKITIIFAFSLFSHQAVSFYPAGSDGTWTITNMREDGIILCTHESPTLNVYERYLIPFKTDASSQISRKMDTYECLLHYINDNLKKGLFLYERYQLSNEHIGIITAGDIVAGVIFDEEKKSDDILKHEADTENSILAFIDRLSHQEFSPQPDGNQNPADINIKEWIKINSQNGIMLTPDKTILLSQANVQTAEWFKPSGSFCVYDPVFLSLKQTTEINTSCFINAASFGTMLSAGASIGSFFFAGTLKHLDDDTLRPLFYGALAVGTGAGFFAGWSYHKDLHDTPLNKANQAFDASNRQHYSLQQTIASLEVSLETTTKSLAAEGYSGNLGQIKRHHSQLSNTARKNYTWEVSPLEEVYENKKMEKKRLECNIEYFNAKKSRYQRAKEESKTLEQQLIDLSKSTSQLNAYTTKLKAKHLTEHQTRIKNNQEKLESIIEKKQRKDNLLRNSDNKITLDDKYNISIIKQRLKDIMPEWQTAKANYQKARQTYQKNYGNTLQMFDNYFLYTRQLDSQRAQSYQTSQQVKILEEQLKALTIWQKLQRKM